MIENIGDYDDDEEDMQVTVDKYHCVLSKCYLNRLSQHCGKN